MYNYHTFSSPAVLVDFLNGTNVGRPLPALVYGLHGLTLVVNDGSTDYTITLADPTSAGLSPSDILDQIRGETITLSAAPATAWVPGDTITGQSSNATAIVVSQTSSLVYKTRQHRGSFALGEIVGVTGTPAKLAQQGGSNPVLATEVNLANVKLRNYGLSPQGWQLAVDGIGYSVKAGTANSILGWPAASSPVVVTEVTSTNIVNIVISIASGQKYCVITHA